MRTAPTIRRRKRNHRPCCAAPPRTPRTTRWISVRVLGGGWTMPQIFVRVSGNVSFSLSACQFVTHATSPGKVRFGTFEGRLYNENLVLNCL